MAEKDVPVASIYQERFCFEIEVLEGLRERGPALFNRHSGYFVALDLIQGMGAI